jgi:hypothetical protein
MNHPRRRWLAAVFVLVLLGAGFAFVALRTGWENWPLLERISGPLRFAEFVATPVPDTIYEIRGGYTAPPGRELVTRFRFRGDIETNAFIGNWRELALYDSSAPFVPALLLIGADHVYLQPAHEGYRYLLVATGRQRGILYIPAAGGTGR